MGTRRKSVLVVFTGSMDLGGIERSLLGLLDAIDYTQYDVDLFLYAHHGPLMPLINKNVHILPEVKELAYLRESFGAKLKHRCFYSAAMRLRDAIKAKVIPVNHDVTWAEVMRRCVPKLEKHYDIALSFFRPFDYIVEKVNADMRVGWVHTDYTKAGEALEPLAEDYARMDYITAVSDQCAETFISLFPQFEDRVITVENILSKEFIWSEAEKLDVSSEMLNDGSINLLSVGRFCDAKNFDNVPDICRKILDAGLNVKWYIIGFGSDETLIRQRIQEAGMEDRVIILGKKENPYPYIKACDLYVQPSRYEGKAVTVREAQMLCKPVVITRYATSASQLEDGVDGVIVPMDNAGCAEGIVRVIRDRELQQELISNMKNRDYTNRSEVQKISRLMEE